MNGKIKFILVGLLITFSTLNVFGVNKKHIAKGFRAGIVLDPGFKFLGGIGFDEKVGIVLKFNEKFSLIPQFGIFPYTYEYKKYENSSESTETKDGTVFNAMLTTRWEFVKAVVDTTTRFKYNIQKREFSRVNYYTPFRPFIQVHAGTFLGAGAGFFYYIYPSLAVGTSVDLGIQVIAADEEGNSGFGITTPQLLIQATF